MKFIYSLAIILAISFGANCADKPLEPVKQVKVQTLPKDVPQYLQDISVTVHVPSGEGSGVLITTADGTTWVLTAGHVIAHCRHDRPTIDPDSGATKRVVEFDDAQIVRIGKDEVDGRIVEESKWDAEVVRYSDADFGDDLALLKVRKKGIKSASTVFYLDSKIPNVGTKIYHCGSLLGQGGSQSVTFGVVSQIGRLIVNKSVFDQNSAPCWPGSSGGIICLEDGRYIGMLVRGAGETFNFYVPIRRIRTWAKKVGVEFVLDPSLPVPTTDELNKKPIEDSLGQHPGERRSDGKKFHFMLYHIPQDQDH